VVGPGRAGPNRRPGGEHQQRPRPPRHPQRAPGRRPPPAPADRQDGHAPTQPRAVRPRRRRPGAGASDARRRRPGQGGP
jgi:hypothetical protein